MGNFRPANCFTTEGTLLNATIALLISPFFAALLSPLLVKAMGYRAAWVLAIMPAAIFIHLTGYIAPVAEGEIFTMGLAWVPSLGANFSFFIDIGLAGGAITVTATTPNVDTDVDLEWWVWLASLGLGGLFGGIVGAIVAAIVLGGPLSAAFAGEVRLPIRILGDSIPEPLTAEPGDPMD